MDFLMIAHRMTKTGVMEIYPKFVVKKSSDLMIRGGDFYAIWVEDRGLWSTDEQDAIHLIDAETDKYAEQHKEQFGSNVRVLHMWDAETHLIDTWHHYCQKQLRDNNHQLDAKLIFADTPVNKQDYASKKLPYSLEKGEPEAWEQILSVLYSEEERRKIEWAIGAIVSGDSKKLQKFLVFYGSGGTGKSTILKIVKKMFDGYVSEFSSQALGSASNTFALEAFASNPLIAMEQDGKLDRIEDNTRLNSLVSHETMLVNEKFKRAYPTSFNSFLMLGTNSPVRITDAKSGLIRRLIDISPTGNLIPRKEYDRLFAQTDFEHGKIAQHCLEVYLSSPGYYDNYVATSMISATNDFYNFVLDSWPVFEKDDGVSLKTAWEMYKAYCTEANVPHPYTYRVVKEELKNYFSTYEERGRSEDGVRMRNWYSGFLKDKFLPQKPKEAEENAAEPEGWVVLDDVTGLLEDGFISPLDALCADCPAQYAKDISETPARAWDSVTTQLRGIVPTRLHYVRPMDQLICIDLDLKGDDGAKSLDRNRASANRFPPTYCETSKSGKGLHLYYIYDGDVNELSSIYDENVEIKVFTGKSSLRRMLTLCNDLPIAHISSGLPLRKEKKMVDERQVKTEIGLKNLLRRVLEKEFGSTKCSIDFAKKILDDAYASDLKYDVHEFRTLLRNFGSQSSHQADYCVNLVSKMHFKSKHFDESMDEISRMGDFPKTNRARRIAFFDIEVFPNVVMINWKEAGQDKPMMRMVNPTPKDIDMLLEYDLIGFNCRKYDNHILHGIRIGLSNQGLYDLSQRIVNGARDAMYSVAYDYSYTDIYDFSSVKQSLKKFEIELGFHHMELGLPWDQPVPEELWTKVSEYCDNDVLATEALFYSKGRQADFLAREILADVAEMSVNDTTNSLTTKIIFDKDKSPQGDFNWRDMSKPAYFNPEDAEELTWMGSTFDVPFDEDRENYLYYPDGWTFHIFDAEGNPTYQEWHRGDPQIPQGYSILPFFPDYRFERGKSIYCGEEVGEGGYVYAEPGMYRNVALLDIASMHPHSVIAEQLFGPQYTGRFQDIVNARIAIKHKEYDRAKTMLGGKLAKYLDDPEKADQLASALKIAINSVYGLTSASFKNPFRDQRNLDNIVAKRGALFMVNLKHEVQKRGFTVAHVKTDSIKIPNATKEIIDFVMNYGQQYGYTFEHEATYDRMCLVNDAVYIAKYAYTDYCYDTYGYIPEKNAKSAKKYAEDGNLNHIWTATGKQFQVPYVYKTLFSHEPITFDDLCVTFSVSSALYLDCEDGSKRFIGKVGQFCPMENGKGGTLVREGTKTSATGVVEKTYGAPPGSKGYIWQESEIVRKLNEEDGKDPCDGINRLYFRAMVDDALTNMSQYGDVNQFCGDDFEEVPF